MSLAFQIRASALNTVSSLVPEGNIPPHMWASNQQTSSYTRHTPVNSPTSSPSQLLCFQTLDLAQLPVGLVVFFSCLGTFCSLKSVFPAEDLEKITFAEGAVIVLLCLGKIYSGGDGHQQVF